MTRMRTALVAAIGVLLSQGCENVTSIPPPPDASVPAGWTVIAAGTTNLNGISGLSDTSVWVVGDQGTIAHWDGNQLTSEKSGTTSNLRGVWAVDANHVYAVGDGGTMLERTAGAWQPVAVGLTREVLTGVWGDAQRVVAVGSHGTVVYGTMGKFKVIPNSDGENLLAVSGTPGAPAVAVGALGLVLDVSGAGLSREPIPAFSKLFTGIAYVPAVAYFVGEQGSVYRVNAAGINPVAGFPPTTLRAVSITGEDAWVVGLDGTICKVNASVTCYPYSDARWFSGVYAASAKSIWVVGASGTILHGLPQESAPVGPTDAGEGGRG
jgi:hypothetical protein